MGRIRLERHKEKTKAYENHAKKIISARVVFIGTTKKDEIERELVKRLTDKMMDEGAIRFATRDISDTGLIEYSAYIQVAREE